MAVFGRQIEQIQLQKVHQSLFWTEKQKLVLQVVSSVEQDLASNGNLCRSFFLSAWSQLEA